MSWSPDSRKIAFTSNTDGNWDIWVVPASGGVAERMVDWPEIDVWPDWSPDGERIAFMSSKARTRGGGPWNIWVIDASLPKDAPLPGPASGGEATWLAEGGAPDWSPDGSEVLFSQEDNIWRVPAAGGTPTRVLETPGAWTWARWSPDGSRILFTRSATSATPSGDIWIADVSGMEVLR